MSNRLKVLVVEDEPLVARRLVRLLGELLPEGATIRRCDDLHEATKLLGADRYDAVFLDLNLMGDDGFDLLGGALLAAQQTVVVSANTDRALEAFEHGVVDFVPKPFDEPRLAIAVERILSPRSKRALGRVVTVKTGREAQAIPVDRIRAIHGAGNYSELELVDGRRPLHNKSLDQLGAELPVEFERSHRSHIVNVAFIKKVRTVEGSRYRVILDDGSELPVSRQRVRALRERLV